MADFQQPNGFTSGVSTPLVQDLTRISFTSGFEAKTGSLSNVDVPADVQSGSKDLQINIANGNHLAGDYIIKISSGTNVVTAMVTVSAKISDTKSNWSNQITVKSVQTTDQVALDIRSFSLYWGGGEVALVCNIMIKSSQTKIAFDVASIGNPAPISIGLINLGSYPNLITALYSDVRDVVNNISRRQTKGAVDVNLDGYITTGFVACYPASISSRPTGSTGYGSCMITTDGTNIVQIFYSSSGSIYSRYSNNNGVTWSTWGMLLDQTSKEEILKTASDTALVWAIVL